VTTVADEPVGHDDPPAERERDAPARLPLVALLVAGVPFLVYSWVTLRGFFGHDDFIILYRAGHGDPLDFGFLFQDYGGHVQPGTFLLAWMETSLAPLNRVVATIPMLAMYGVALFLFWRVLIRCLGPSWVVVPLLGVLSSSPLVLYPTVWWAYGMALLPVLVTMAAALLAHLRYLESGEVRHAVHTVLWTVAGMLFFEKAALITAVLFGVTVVRGDTVWEALVKHWRVWAVHGGLLACYAVLYFGLTASQTDRGPVPASQVAEFAYRGVVDTFLPGILGGPFAASGGGSIWVTPPLVVRVLAVLATLVLIAVTVRRNRRQATLAWVLLAGYLAVDLALVAVTRLAAIGPLVGADPRYFADAVPVAVLCAGFALRGHRPGKVPAVAVAVLLVVGGIASFLRIAPALQFRDAREYVATAQAAFAEQPGIVLYDTGVPRTVILNWFPYDAFTSRVVGLLPEAPRFDRPAETLYKLDGEGRPQPIRTLTDSVGGEPGPAPDCGHLVEAEPVRIPLKSVSFGRRVLKLGYYTSDTGDGTIVVGDTRVPVSFEEGLHVLHVVVTGTYTHVEVTRNANQAPMCVTDVEIGLPK
jgi:hypothetical protein